MSKIPNLNNIFQGVKDKIVSTTDKVNQVPNKSSQQKTVPTPKESAAESEKENVSNNINPAQVWGDYQNMQNDNSSSSDDKVTANAKIEDSPLDNKNLFQAYQEQKDIGEDMSFSSSRDLRDHRDTVIDYLRDRGIDSLTLEIVNETIRKLYPDISDTQFKQIKDIVFSDFYNISDIRQQERFDDEYNSVLESYGSEVERQLPRFGE